MSGQYARLAELENEKLSMIIALREAMLALSDIMTENGAEAAAAGFQRCGELMGKIDGVVRDIRALPQPDEEARRELDTIRQQQHDLLYETFCINEKLIERGKAVKQELFRKIRSLNRSRNIVNRYYNSGVQTGFLLDFKERV